MFNERKVTHLAAYFLQKNGAGMPHLKLMKLLYLADRESIRRFGYPMSDDEFVSMPHGPVLSRTLHLINGYKRARGDWANTIADKANHQVALKPGAKDLQLDELSRADREVMNAVWKKFGAMNQWEIRDYTHENCAEWKDPHGSSKPISLEKIFRAVHEDEEQIKLMLEDIADRKHIKKVFASLR